LEDIELDDEVIDLIDVMEVVFKELNEQEKSK